jgi:hypothetical protein
MKPDLYTKAVLTVIAFMLVMIGFREFVNPTTTVSAEGPFSGVQFSGDTDTFTLFDSRTGDIWSYNLGTEKPYVDHTRIPAPGVPFSAVQWNIQ